MGGGVAVLCVCMHTGFRSSVDERNEGLDSSCEREVNIVLFREEDRHRRMSWGADCREAEDAWM